MRNLITDVKRHTLKPRPGYYHLKTTNIYIPFVKVTIECLTRKITELNLFFESILRLIEISVNDVNEIANILGVSYSVIKEAIIDMVGIDYVYASENTLSITAKGINALRTRKRVDIRKTYLKDILIDTITGKIYDADTVKTVKVYKRDVVLEGIVQIDKNYLDSHFQEINDVYQLQQKNSSVFVNNAVTKELYKIIGVSYSELHYVENKVHMYKNESSDELAFELLTDHNDEYKREFYNQLKDSCRPCQEYFFERNRTLVNRISSMDKTIDADLMAQTEKMRALLYSDSKAEEVEVEDFTRKRYALYDYEYMSYLYFPRVLGYKRIFVCANHLDGILTQSFCSQINLLAEKIPIFLIYDKGEYNVENSLKYHFKAPSTNLMFCPREGVAENLICFDSEAVMELQENIVTAFERPVLYTQAICDFDKKRVSEIVSRLVKKYNIEIDVADKE